MPLILPAFRPELLAFDLDGTLLADRGQELTGGTGSVLARLKAQGMRVAIITGRDRLSRSLQGSIGADAVATGNGAEVHFADGIYQRELLAEADVDLLLRHGLQDAQVVLYGVNGYSVDTSCAEVPADWMEKYNCPPIGPEHRRTAFKVRYKHAEAAAWAEHLRANYPHLTVTGGMAPYPHEVDVTCASANKGAILRRIVEHLGVSPLRVMAFGDSDNDAPLLREAAFGVQVGTHAHLTDLAKMRLARQEDLEAYLLALEDRVMAAPAC